MGYTKTQVRTALGKAREAGKTCEGLSVGLRDTELQLESWGFLPLPGDRDVDQRVADWYRSQGLVMVEKVEAPEPTPAAPAPVASSEAALAAAEAALGAATAALALARSMSSTPPPERRHSGVAQT